MLTAIIRLKIVIKIDNNITIFFQKKMVACASATPLTNVYFIGGKAPRILNLCRVWRRVISVKVCRFTFQRRPYVHEIWHRSSEELKYSIPYRGSNQVNALLIDPIWPFIKEVKQGFYCASHKV
jgi:hypothetical protein